MRKKIFAGLLISMICWACNSKISEFEEIRFEESSVILKENLKPISPISSFDVLADESIVAITETQELVFFSPSGEQIGFGPKKGEGNLELFSPSLIKALGSHFYIWDNVLMKFVEFDGDFNPTAEYKGFENSVSDFDVDEDYIYCYIDPLPGEPFIEVYNKLAGTVTFRLGNTEKEQLITSLNRCGGGINIYNGDLLFLASHKFQLNRASPAYFPAYSPNFIEDSEFEYKKFEGDPVDLINSDIQKAIELSLSMPIFMGIHVMNDAILVRGETGSVRFEGRSIDLKERKNFMVLLDNNLKILGKAFQDFDHDSPCKLWADSPSGLYKISMEEGEDEFIYRLVKMTVAN